jgi:polyribonucleotide nucleotidyltransferase
VNEIKKTFQYGQHEVTLSTGLIARQATSAVMVTMGETVVLVTVVAAKNAIPGRDFFPLTVNYQEKTYAGGKIPGGFFKREGRPAERETLIARLIDRPVRPLFPDEFTNEVQVVATLMSLDPTVSPDIVAMIGTSAALMLSGIPFQGPIGAARVGYTNNEYLLNPSVEAIASSDLDMVVAGTHDAVLMVESEASELSESVMLAAVVFAHEQMQVVIKAILEFVASAGNPSWNWAAPAFNDQLFNQVATLTKTAIGDAYLIKDKLERQTRLGVIREDLLAALRPEEQVKSHPESLPAVSDIVEMMGKLEKDIVRGRILAGDARIDGRNLTTIRKISTQAGFLPRVHGSALFTRGETQAIVAATIGTTRDAQIIDSLQGEVRDVFMLHYNFPPYCVGETGMMGSPKRREIGHGMLAKRAVLGVLPSQEEFPYVIRVVSEITESNGSSSMASVCGTSLALMDAGVPLKAPVAGIAMGLIKDGDRFAVISDILGDEDHLGDMDFKVAGTAQGVTALQMDIKINGITKEIMEKALHQAHEGRIHILGEMAKTLTEPRTQLSAYAPRIYTFKVPPDKIREIIGKGGATIQNITKTSGTTIDITDDGQVSIAAVDELGAMSARRQIEAIIQEFEIDTLYHGKVVKITDFGAFVALAPGKEGLVHISQICDRRLQSVTEELSEGQAVIVKVIEIDKQGRVRLSMRDVDQPTPAA